MKTQNYFVAVAFITLVLNSGVLWGQSSYTSPFIHTGSYYGNSVPTTPLPTSRGDTYNFNAVQDVLARSAAEKRASQESSQQRALEFEQRTQARIERDSQSSEAMRASIRESNRRRDDSFNSAITDLNNTMTRDSSSSSYSGGSYETSRSSGYSSAPYETSRSSDYYPGESPARTALRNIPVPRVDDEELYVDEEVINRQNTEKAVNLATITTQSQARVEMEELEREAAEVWKKAQNRVTAKTSKEFEQSYREWVSVPPDQRDQEKRPVLLENGQKSTVGEEKQKDREELERRFDRRKPQSMRKFKN
jgi:hypothetical protein